MYNLSDYGYGLPESLIAQAPCEHRSLSRLMHLNRRRHSISHHRFLDISDLLRPGDLLVVNDTRVVPARLLGHKPTGGRIEVLIIDYAAGMKHLTDTGRFQCDCLIRASRRPEPGTVLDLGQDIKATVIEHRDRISVVSFDGGNEFLSRLKKAGKMPLPPYIRRDQNPGQGGGTQAQTDAQLYEQKDRQDYQTVYAAAEGAVAAPTAGLHFTQDLLETLCARGVDLARITLHVGYGTFVPVRVKDIRDHQIHSEYFIVTEQTAEQINQARRQGRRIIAVGTTAVRTLEFCAGDGGRICPGQGRCDLFIYPGYRFKCVDAMITNFHLPESTLLMLISAFYDRERILDAYQVAVAEKYRFFSYGDAMFIE
ncbi:tRNA preQ1(34) S-adenosylmethionine ribosyltransferase-isomerase QueA [Desulfobacter vibrioformis]|uniref:tRNA preQ1(34) S-adenosylmethionine ribosyltransferase-isomerase QueA n=1 Tax=Desulfobacter vibrioformis TaxID=34031 RepID=UPI000555B754|nr:tRNA preQ1(34) S-adenosylmethionine ribosyltransferase-isomerase QueA [Desulfobacter vibrioformis]